MKDETIMNSDSQVYEILCFLAVADARRDLFAKLYPEKLEEFDRLVKKLWAVFYE